MPCTASRQQVYVGISRFKLVVVTAAEAIGVAFVRELQLDIYASEKAPLALLVRTEAALDIENSRHPQVPAAGKSVSVPKSAEGQLRRNLSSTSPASGEVHDGEALGSRLP